VNVGQRFGRPNRRFIPITSRCASRAHLRAYTPPGRQDGFSEGNTKYYWAFGRRIAMRIHSSVPSNPGTVSYFLADHLGSTNTTLHSSGAVMQNTRYRPYGWLRRGEGGMTEKLFTGQQREYGAPGFGLYYYGARFYSTVLGRFLSPDPLVVAPGDPQMLDRYAYVRNNPLRYVARTMSG